MQQQRWGGCKRDGPTGNLEHVGFPEKRVGREKAGRERTGYHKEGMGEQPRTSEEAGSRAVAGLGGKGQDL